MGSIGSMVPLEEVIWGAAGDVGFSSPWSRVKLQAAAERGGGKDALKNILQSVAVAEAREMAGLPPYMTHGIRAAKLTDTLAFLET